MTDASRSDLVSDWRDPEIDVEAEFASMRDRAREIRSLISSGGAEVEEPPRGDFRPATTSAVLPSPSIDGRPDSQSWPDAWKEPHLRWRDRVWYLAKWGLPAPDTLNFALLDLAQWLHGVELYDAEGEEEQVHRLLQRFCAPGTTTSPTDCVGSRTSNAYPWSSSRRSSLRRRTP